MDSVCEGDGNRVNRIWRNLHICAAGCTHYALEAFNLLAQEKFYRARD